MQVAYPTDAEDKIDWPHETTAMDGLIGKDYYTNYMLIERLSVERDFDKIDEKPNRRDWGSSSPLMVHTHTHTHTHTHVQPNRRDWGAALRR